MSVAFATELQPFEFGKGRNAEINWSHKHAQGLVSAHVLQSEIDLVDGAEGALYSTAKISKEGLDLTVGQNVTSANGDRAEVANQAIYDAIDNDSWTFITRLRPDALNYTVVIATMGRPSGNAMCYYFFLTQGGDLKFATMDGAWHSFVLQTGVTVNTSTFVDVAMRYDGTNLTATVDGVDSTPVGFLSSYFPTAGDTPFILGSAHASGASDNLWTESLTIEYAYFYDYVMDYADIADLQSGPYQMMDRFDDWLMVVAGTTHDVSVADGIGVASVQAVIASLEGSRAESVALTTNQAVLMQAETTVVDSLEVDLVSGVDANRFTTTALALSLVDAPAVTQSAEVSRAESLAITDARSAGLNFNASIVESIVASLAASAEVVILASVAEAITTSDAVLVQSDFDASALEALGVAGVEAVTANQNVVNEANLAISLAVAVEAASLCSTTEAIQITLTANEPFGVLVYREKVPLRGLIGKNSLTGTISNILLTPKR